MAGGHTSQLTLEDLNMRGLGKTSLKIFKKVGNFHDLGGGGGVREGHFLDLFETAQ